MYPGKQWFLHRDNSIGHKRSPAGYSRYRRQRQSYCGYGRNVWKRFPRIRAAFVQPGSRFSNVAPMLEQQFVLPGLRIRVACSCLDVGGPSANLLFNLYPSIAYKIITDRQPYLTNPSQFYWWFDWSRRTLDSSTCVTRRLYQIKISASRQHGRQADRICPKKSCPPSVWTYSSHIHFEPRKQIPGNDSIKYAEPSYALFESWMILTLPALRNSNGPATAFFWTSNHRKEVARTENPMVFLLIPVSFAKLACSDKERYQQGSLVEEAST